VTNASPGNPSDLRQPPLPNPFQKNHSRNLCTNQTAYPFPAIQSNPTHHYHHHHRSFSPRLLPLHPLPPSLPSFSSSPSPNPSSSSLTIHLISNLSPSKASLPPKQNASAAVSFHSSSTSFFLSPTARAQDPYDIIICFITVTALYPP
jgi:hypothetical protein